MPELVRCEPPTTPAGRQSGADRLAPRRWTSVVRVSARDDAEQRSDRELSRWSCHGWSCCQPHRPSRPHGGDRPCHGGRDRATPRSRSDFAQRERLGSPAGPPEDTIKPSQALAVRRVTGPTHHDDDFLDLRRIGRIAKTFVARRPPRMEPWHRRRRTTAASASSTTSDMTPPRARRYEPELALRHQSGSRDLTCSLLVLPLSTSAAASGPAARRCPAKSVSGSAHLRPSISRRRRSMPTEARAPTALTAGSVALAAPMLAAGIHSPPGQGHVLLVDAQLGESPPANSSVESHRRWRSLAPGIQSGSATNAASMKLAACPT